MKHWIVQVMTIEGARLRIKTTREAGIRKVREIVAKREQSERELGGRFTIRFYHEFSRGAI